MFTVASARADTYSWTNFQSDIPGVAQHVDPNLVNPLGHGSLVNLVKWRHLGQRQRHWRLDTRTIRMAQRDPLVVEIPTAERNRGVGNPTGIVSNTTAIFPGDKEWNLVAGSVYLCQ